MLKRVWMAQDVQCRYVDALWWAEVSAWLLLLLIHPKNSVKHPPTDKRPWLCTRCCNMYILYCVK